jgi:hypothetical protein
MKAFTCSAEAKQRDDPTDGIGMESPPLPQMDYD